MELFTGNQQLLTFGRGGRSTIRSFWGLGGEWIEVYAGDKPGEERHRIEQKDGKVYWNTVRVPTSGGGEEGEPS